MSETLHTLYRWNCETSQWDRLGSLEKEAEARQWAWEENRMGRFVWVVPERQRSRELVPVEPITHMAASVSSQASDLVVTGSGGEAKYDQSPAMPTNVITKLDTMINFLDQSAWYHGLVAVVFACISARVLASVVSGTVPGLFLGLFGLAIFANIFAQGVQRVMTVIMLLRAYRASPEIAPIQSCADLIQSIDGQPNGSDSEGNS